MQFFELYKLLLSSSHTLSLGILRSRSLARGFVGAPGCGHSGGVLLGCGIHDMSSAQAGVLCMLLAGLHIYSILYACLLTMMSFDLNVGMWHVH